MINPACRRFAAFAGILVVLAISSGTITVGVAAAEPKIDGERVLIRGPVGAELSGLLRLSVDEPTDVFLLPGPLEWVDSDPGNAIPKVPDPSAGPVAPAACRVVGACLPASVVTLKPVSVKLEPGVPTDIAVTVAKIEQPGIYQGKIEIRHRTAASGSAAPAPTTDPTYVTLTVAVSPTPGLTLLGGEKVVLHHARLTNGFDQFLAPFFLDPIESSDRLDLPALNLTAATMTLASGNVVLVGERSGRVLTPAEVSIPELQTTPRRVESNVSLPLSIKLAMATVVPDHYTGAVYLRFENMAAPQAIPLSLDVRRGPLGPLLLLVLGVVLGAFLRAMASRGDPVLAVSDRLDRLHEQIDRAAVTEADHDALIRLADRARRQVEFGRLADADGSADDLETSMAILEDLTELGHDQAAEARQIRRYVYMRDVDSATPALKSWRKSLAEAPPEPPVESSEPIGAPAPVDHRLRRETRSARWFALGGIAVALVTVLVLPLTLTRLGAVGAAGPNPDDNPSTTAYWTALTVITIVAILILVVHRPLLRRVPAHQRIRLLKAARYAVQGLSATALVLAGMKILYAEDVLGFVGPAAASVLPFILWGVGTDVSSRSLAGLVIKS